MVDFREKQKLANINAQQEVSFRIFSFAREAKPVPPLGPTLGQYNVNLVEFVKKFNEQTSAFPAGLYISGVVTKKLKGKDFTLNLKKIPLKVLLEVFFTDYLQSDDPVYVESVNEIPFEVLFGLIKFYSWLHEINIRSSARLVLSNLSCNVLIKRIKIKRKNENTTDNR